MAEPITDEQRIEVREVLADIGHNWGDYQIAVNAPEWLAAYEAALAHEQARADAAEARLDFLRAHVWQLLQERAMERLRIGTGGTR